MSQYTIEFLDLISLLLEKPIGEIVEYTITGNTIVYIQRLNPSDRLRANDCLFIVVCNTGSVTQIIPSERVLTTKDKECGRLLKDVLENNPNIRIVARHVRKP